VIIVHYGRVVNRYALARDASAETEPKGSPVSEMQIWVSKNEDDSKRLPSRSRLVVLKKRGAGKCSYGWKALCTRTFNADDRTPRWLFEC